MKNIFRLLTVTVFTLFFVAVNNSRIMAYTLDPSSGTKTANTTANISLIAAPQTGENQVMVDLDFTNITVLGFTPNPNFITLPQCPGFLQFTSTRVCVGTAKTSGTLIAGESLGTVQIRWGSNGAANIEATSDSKYIFTTGERVDSGVKGIYTIGTVALPSTPLIETSVDRYLFIISGVALILLGFYLSSKSKAGTADAQIEIS